MWNRQELKQRAKNILSATYWPSLAVSVICVLCNGGIGGGSFGGSSSSDSSDSGSFSNPFTSPEFSEAIAQILAVLAVFFVIFAVALLVAIAFSTFVSNPMQLGANKFFIQSAYGETRFSYIEHAFKNNYLNGVKVMFLKNLFITLWSFLLIIPGIIKRYEYWFVEYILAENPDIEYTRAFEISKAVTNGQKWNIFVFELSFIGWFLLGSIILCGIGTYFVYPYYFASKTQLYLTLKSYALSNSIAYDTDFAHYKIY